MANQGQWKWMITIQVPLIRTQEQPSITISIINPMSDKIPLIMNVNSTIGLMVNSDLGDPEVGTPPSTVDQWKPEPAIGGAAPWHHAASPLCHPRDNDDHWRQEPIITTTSSDVSSLFLLNIAKGNVWWVFSSMFKYMSFSSVLGDDCLRTWLPCSIIQPVIDQY